MDLLGEQTVQVMASVLQAACLLLAAIGVVLTVRKASAGRIPARVIAPMQLRLMPIERTNRLSDQVLHNVLPARAPPDPVDRDLPSGEEPRGR